MGSSPTLEKAGYQEESPSEAGRINELAAELQEDVRRMSSATELDEQETKALEQFIVNGGVDPETYAGCLQTAMDKLQPLIAFWREIVQGSSIDELNLKMYVLNCRLLSRANGESYLGFLKTVTSIRNNFKDITLPVVYEAQVLLIKELADLAFHEKEVETLLDNTPETPEEVIEEIEQALSGAEASSPEVLASNRTDELNIDDLPPPVREAVIYILEGGEIIPAKRDNARKALALLAGRDLEPEALKRYAHLNQARILGPPKKPKVVTAASSKTMLAESSPVQELARPFSPGKCVDADPDTFFPEKGGSTREAKRICAGCEVKVECLEYALANDERFGIWGGFSERERRKMKRLAS